MAVDVSDQPASAVATPVRFTFDDYVKYTEEHAGDFELRDGVIVAMSPEDDAHMLTRKTLDQYLHRTLDPTRYSAFTESSFPCPGWADGPRPDNFVARGALLDEGRRPVAADIALIVEIASDEARLKDDRNKTETYASVRVAEYRIVDLLHRSVLVHREPEGTNYTFIETKRPGVTITAVAVDGLTFASSAGLPPALLLRAVRIGWLALFRPLLSSVQSTLRQFHRLLNPTPVARDRSMVPR